MFWNGVTSNVHSLTAVAGAGKSRWIVEQIDKSVRRDGVNPCDVLALSYTRKSAAELGERVNGAIKPYFVSVSTVHSAAWQHVKRCYPDASVATDEYLANQLVERLDCSPVEAAALAADASTWLERGGLPGEWWPHPSFRQIPENLRIDQIAEAMESAFNERLHRKLFGYSDLLTVAYRVADSAPSLVFLDEAQDLSPFQGLLIRRWAELGSTVWLVGDTEQSIYGFRGADPSLLATAPNRMNLCHNYRSGSAIVEVGSALRADGLAMLPAPRAESGLVKVFEHKNFDELCGFVAVMQNMAVDVGVASQVLVRTQAEKRYLTTALTIHEAKGLEWPIVHVAGFSNGRLPSRLALTAAEVAEERRLAYVACTRAKGCLVLHTVKDRRSPFMDLLPRWVVEE